MKCKKLLIIDQLSCMSLIYALLFRVLGFNSIYLEVHWRLKNIKLLNLLSGIDICMVDYSSFRYYDWSKRISVSAHLSRKAYSKIFDNNDLKKYEGFFQGVEDIDKKLKVIIVSMLAGMFGDLANVLICAEYYRKSFEIVRIYAKSNGFVKIALNDKEFQDIKNISTSAFRYVYSYVPKIVKLTLRTFSIGIKYVLRIVKHEDICGNKKVVNDKDKDLSKYEVLFFPHQGAVVHSKFFLKDHFYIDDPYSPFYRDNIFHIEYQKVADEETNKNVVSEYEENDIPYCYIPEIGSYSSKIRIFRDILYFFSRNIFRKSCFLKMILFLNIYKQYNNYFGFLAKFKNAKIALVGYDILFPKCLSMALSAKGINTVATQERLITSYYDICNVMLDYYFVVKMSLKERFSSNDASFVKTLVPIGPIRSDLIHKFKKCNDDKIEDIKKKYRLVIAYDFYSPKTYFESKSNQCINWENNLLFYNDLIMLSKDFPDVYVVIRGKDDNWCSLPLFAKVYKEILSLPNIEINRDYSEINISYKLASQADLIIAKHTSIGDEALASGIPVLFHDYSQNMEQMVSAVFNYDNYPLFVYSYEDLKARVQEIINGTDPLNDDLLEKMKREFFGITKNETVKEKLHGELEKIYLNTIKTDKSNDRICS